MEAVKNTKQLEDGIMTRLFDEATPQGQGWIIEDYRNRISKGVLGFIPPRSPRRCVIEAIATTFNVTVAQIRGCGQSSDVIAARWSAMWALSARHGLSTTQIGRLLNKDHTTVSNALKNVEQRVLKDPDYSAKLRQALCTAEGS